MNKSVRIFVTVLSAVVLAGCGNSSERPSLDGAFGPIALGGLEPHQFESLSDIVKRTPTIVLGEVESVGKGRTTGPAGDRFRYALVTVKVTELMKGELQNRKSMALELFMSMESEDEKVRELDAALRGLEGMFFVSNKADELRRGSPGARSTELQTERPYYILISSQGVFFDQGGSAHNPYSDNPQFPGKVDGTDFDQLVLTVRAQSSAK